MSKLKEIIDGWANLTRDKFGRLDEQTKLMAKDRLHKCDSCLMRSGNICDPSKRINHMITNEIVRGCGCNLSAKTLSPDSSCPAGKW